jgi:nitrous oxide reductase
MTPQRMSRRSVLRGAAGAGAAGLVAAGTATTLAAATTTSTRAEGPDAQDAVRPDGPVMVYLSDASTGEMDVFAGTSQVRVRDPALVGQLLRAIQ